MTTNRHTKALLTTLLLFAALVFPLSYLAYYKINFSPDAWAVKKTDDFLLMTKNNNFLTKDSMRLKVHILVRVTKCKSDCSLEKKQLNELYNRISDQVDLNSKEEISIVIASKINNFTDANRYVEIDVDASEAGLNALLPQAKENFEIFIFDRLVQRSGPFTDAMDEDGYLEKNLSKVLFDQYLYDYLSTRTFFGPKRNHS